MEISKNELEALIKGAGFTLSSSQFTSADVVKLIETNETNTFDTNLKYLEAEDLEAFDITSAFVNANK